MEKLIVDLRDNPGGVLSSVCDVLRQILPEGLIVYTEDKYGEKQEMKCDGDTPIDIPLAVLVNENSASASEILAGALQDTGAATLVGTKSYGKGSVQTVVPLFHEDGIKLTIAKYYTPNGRCIDGIGIDPDVEVQRNDSDTTDVQLEKAQEVLQEKVDNN